MMTGFPVKFCGRLLGDATEEVEASFHSFVYTFFNPAPGVSIAPGDLQIDFDTGKYTVWENYDLPEIVETGDIFTTISSLPRLHGA